MKPIGIISDTHCHSWSSFSKPLPSGINNRLQHILDGILQAGRETLAAGGTTLYITGDLMHKRGEISPMVLNPLIDTFDELDNMGIETRVLTGNHDLESRNSEALSNSCESLRKSKGVKIVSKPTMFGDDKVAMVPWYDSIDDVRKHIKTLVSEIELIDDVSEWTLMLHAPVNGVLIGIPDHGFYAKELEVLGFKRVFSGHYHNGKEFPGDVFSVGALTHQTWNDVGTTAGILIASDAGVVRTETKAPKFKDFDLSWDDDTAAQECEGNYMRLKLGEATDDEITMLRDHISGLGGVGVLVQAIPIPKGVAKSRTAATVAAPTVRQSINEWISAHSPAKGRTEIEKLAAAIMDESEAVDA